MQRQIVKIVISAGIIVLGVMLNSAISYSLNVEDKIIFTDKEKQFAFHYPKTWKRVDAAYVDTRVKIVSKGGRGSENCGVNVKYHKDAVGMSPSYFSKNVAPTTLNKVLAAMKTEFPDATITESGPTLLANQEAFYCVFFGAKRTSDYIAKIATFSVQTIRNGNIYTVSCTCKQSDFKRLFPMFKKIMTGFIFTD